ncbi:TonB-dependent receptor [bacterium]|nr:TonB-dependent receptor [bacterium]
MSSTTRALHRSAVLLLLSSKFAGLSPLAAEETETLATTTVVANRIVTPLAQSGSAVTVIEGEMLEEAQVFRLEDALRRSPGVFSESTGGQRGSISSLFLRGMKTAHAHVRVDGVRLSDSTVSTNNFLGNGLLDGVGRFEILRGPQSALYGGESIGGVIGVYSEQGSGTPESRVFVEGGSFGTLRTGASSSGSFDSGLSYSLGIGWETTENDAQGTPELDHEQLAYALRLDYDVSDHARFGATFRGGHGEFHDTFGGENFTDYRLVTVYGEIDITDTWQSRLQFGSYTESYDFGQPSTFATDAEKLSLGWENEVKCSGDHTTAFGALFEQTDFAQDFSFPADRDQLGLFATHLWEVSDDLLLTGGIRWEDYDDYGDEFTWRTTAAYTIPNSETTLRGSYGTAFRTPNLLELNGGPFEAGNPNLSPERSEGWDLGITQSFGDDVSLNLTWFENDVKNLIVDRFGATPFNTAGEGKASGLELGLEGQAGSVRYGLAYTYLDDSLVGLPEHVVQAHLHWEASDQLDLGVEVSYVGERNLGGDPLDAYLVTKLYGSYEVNDHVTINARLENAFDERYEHASFGGTPVAARRLGAFAGLTVTW